MLFNNVTEDLECRRRLKDPNLSSDIAWEQMAKPQTDDYDSVTTLRFAEMSGYMKARIPAERAFFEGSIAIRDDAMSKIPPNCVKAPHDHPNIDRACELTRLWPSAFKQCQMLIDTFSPIMLAGSMLDAKSVSLSYSAPGSKGFGSVIATIDNVLALAESLVYQLAQSKFRALDIVVESPTNDGVLSPMHTDCLQSIYDVFAAEYGLAYATVLDMNMIHSTKHIDDRAVLYSLADNLARLEFGYNVLQDKAVMSDASGVAFISGFDAWLEEIFRDAGKLLEGCGVRLQTYLHPLRDNCNSVSEPGHWNITDSHDSIRRQISGELSHFSDYTRHSEISTGIWGGLKPATENTMELRPCRRAHILEHPIGEEHLIYDPSMEFALVLNNSAKEVFDLCDGTQTVAEISHVIATKFDIDKEKVVDYVAMAINQLARTGILFVMNPS